MNEIKTNTENEKHRAQSLESIVAKIFFSLLAIFLGLALPGILDGINSSMVESMASAGEGVPPEAMDRIGKLGCNIASTLCQIMGFVTLIYGLFNFARYICLNEVPESDATGEIETVKIVKKSKLTGEKNVRKVSGYRYKCDYCGREYLLGKKFTGFVPNCKSCGAVLERKMPISDEDCDERTA